jgi:hypothetical protein
MTPEGEGHRPPADLAPVAAQKIHRAAVEQDIHLHPLSQTDILELTYCLLKERLKPTELEDLHWDDYKGPRQKS